MLCFFEKELVEKKKWISNEEFMESVAIGQMTPGAPIVNTGICIGYKLKNMMGAIAVTISQSLPGVLLAILLAYTYVHVQDNHLLKSAMKGVGGAVVGLLAAIIYKMARKNIKNARTALFGLAAFIFLFVFKINAIYIIIASGVIGLFVFKKEKSI